MTVGEIGRFTSAFYEPKPMLANFRRLADELELPWDKQLKAMSKGTRAKVALALALAQEPELLILDEPTSGLDLLVRREILDRMVDVAASGRTVLLSSHQINEVERVADTVAILHRGKLVTLSPLEDLKRQTQELTFTMTNGASPPPITGEVLRERRQARQWQILVRNCPTEQIDVLRTEPEVSTLEVRTPRLEEIVASYLQSERRERNATSPKEAAQ